MGGQGFVVGEDRSGSVSGTRTVERERGRVAMLAGLATWAGELGWQRRLNGDAERHPAAGLIIGYAAVPNMPSTKQ